MFFTVFIVIVALLCLAGIAAVVLRKFPQLTMIDTAAIPKERDAIRKRQIAEERVHRAMTGFGRHVAEWSTAAFAFLRARFRALYARLIELEREMRPRPPRTEIAKMVPELVAEAEEFLKAEDWSGAEKRYIEILKLDRKHVDAYWGLAACQVMTKRHAEAAEIYSYLVKLLRRRAGCTHDDAFVAPSDRACTAPAEAHAEVATAFAELGLARRDAGDHVAARSGFEAAIAFGGDNPRHLDLLLEACILTGDKARALRVFERLSGANPDNQKLPSLADRIAAMPEQEGKRQGK